MAARQEAAHTKKLEQALRSHERFPINLEWMVDVFKYKHISSLTTHLKRHFKMNVHYKRFAQEQNKRVWTYFITVECFIGICEYVRHAARKKIANVWLRKVGIKGGSRKTTQEYEDDCGPFSEEDLEDDEDEEEGEGEEEELYEYYDDSQSPTKRRRIDEDEEYMCEEDDEEETEERAFFQEMEEEEASASYETDESVDYESTSSSRANSPAFHHAGALAVSSPNMYSPVKIGNAHFRIIASSSSDTLNSSSDSSISPPSSPISPIPERAFPPAAPVSPPVSPSSRPQWVPFIKPHIPECEVVPPDVTELCKEQVDWSYLHLRPNPHPLASMYSAPAKFYPSVMLGPQYFAYPQVTPYLIGPGSFLSNCHALHTPNMLVDPNGYPLRTARHDMDNLHCDLPNMEERQFDTNMFLSFPDEHHYQF